MSNTRKAKMHPTMTTQVLTDIDSVLGQKQDKMTTTQIRRYLREHRQELIENGFEGAPVEVTDYVLNSTREHHEEILHTVGMA